MSAPKPPCGTERGYRWHYKQGDTNCAPCRKAWSLSRKRQHIFGGNFYRDGGRARQHLKGLVEVGMTYPAIAKRAGINEDTIYMLVSGRVRRVTEPVESAILGVQPCPSPTGLISSAGTLRRIHALMAIGWSHDEISAHCGMSTKVLANSRRPRVTVRVATAVRVTYDELSMTPGPNRVTESRAARLGYAPPLAWDDETIDDPDAQPDLGADPEPRGKVAESRASRPLDEVAVERAMAGMLRFPPSSLPIPELLEAIRRLAARGMSDHQIGQRLQMKRDTVCQNRKRHGIPAGQPRESAA